MNTHSTRNDEENPGPALGVHRVWKERGETLAVLVRRSRIEHTIDESVPMTYAGRLDPMAEGIVILLAGDARFEKEKYSKLDKTYKFQVLFGVATDTYDVLGVTTGTQVSPTKTISKDELEQVLENIKTTPFPYPPFSSKPVDGMPLFMRAREGTLPHEMPIQTGVPKSLELVQEEVVQLPELIDVIISDIQKVEGDFRQQEIIGGWQKLKETYSDPTVPLLTFEATVPSGVYIRSIAHAMGEMLGCPALAYTITRTEIENI